MEAIERLADLINQSQSTVFFGGAGTSTESNVPDFRSKDGLYSQSFNGFKPEEVLSRDFFFKHTALFYDYLRTYLIKEDVRPHIGHECLVTLEKAGLLSTIVTQNIDNLHQIAGSQSVLELHGSLGHYTCLDCGGGMSYETISFEADNLPHCSKCEGLLKPDVVLYQEALDETVIRDAVEAISKADLLIICGTSLVVYPAAGFIRYFKGKNLVLINKDATPYDHKASLVIHESFGHTFKGLVDHLKL